MKTSVTSFITKFLMLLTALFLSYPGNMAAQNYQWAFGMGGTSYDDGNGIGTDAAGNVYMTGEFWNSFDADPGPGTAILTATNGYHFYLAKYDAAGNYRWAFTLQGGYGYAYSLIIDSSANVIISGRYNDNGPVDFDPGPGVANLGSTGDPSFIAKYDSAGNYVWAKRLGGPLGSGCDADALAFDPQGNLLVTGSFYQAIDFDPGLQTANLGSISGGRDVFVAKYNASGQYIWAFSLAGNGYDNGNEVSTDDSGNVYITGDFGYSNDSIDMDPGSGSAVLTSAGVWSTFVAKYDSAGNYKWAFKIDGGANGNCQSSNITLDDSANIYLTGAFRYIVDIDPGPGTTTISYAGPTWGSYFAKYNSAGSFQWGFCLGDSINRFSANNIVMCNDGTFYLGGWFSGVLDFDPDTSSFFLNWANGGCFFARYKNSGVFLDAVNFGGIYTSISRMALTSSYDLFLLGVFSSSGDYDPGPASNIILSHGYYDVFVAKYEITPNTITETKTKENFQIFPNPFSDYFIIKTNSISKKRVTIFSLLSEKVKEFEFSDEQAQEDLKNLPPGIYFVKISDRKEAFVKKIVKQ